MQAIISHRDSRELVVTSIQSGIHDLKLQVMPTVCLISASSIRQHEKLRSLVKDVLNLDCVFFLSWGLAADEIHDLVDEVIETGNKAWLDVVTTSHKEDQFSDVAWFFLNATYLDSGTFRCLALLEDRDEENSQISAKLLKLHLEGEHNGLG